MSNHTEQSVRPLTFTQTLVLADATVANTDTSMARRTEEGRRQLSVFGLTQNHRLSYRPQPISTREAVLAGRSLLNLPAGKYDESFLHFTFNTLSVYPGRPFSAQLISEWWLASILKDIGIHFVTALDAYAALPAAKTNFIVIKAVELLNWFSDEQMYGLKWSPETSRIALLRNAAKLGLLLRWTLYKARMNGDDIKKLEQDLELARKSFAAPQGWKVMREIEKESTALIRERNELNEAFDEEVALEPVGGFPSVESFTKPIYNIRTVEDDCIICKCRPDVLTNVCKHPYCKECLNTWLDTCKPHVYKCCYCRQAMFPKPRFRPVPNGRNFEEELTAVEQEFQRVEQHRQSLLWFDQELELHKKVANYMKYQPRKRQKVANE